MLRYSVFTLLTMLSLFSLLVFIGAVKKATEGWVRTIAKIYFEEMLIFQTKLMGAMTEELKQVMGKDITKSTIN